jgi:hypothetical protein
MESITLTEGIVVAAITAITAILGAWFAAKAAYLKAGVDHVATEAQARQALRDDMMAYIEELRAEVKALREENAALRSENSALRARVRDLETELARICGERHDKKGAA